MKFPACIFKPIIFNNQISGQRQPNFQLRPIKSSNKFGKVIAKNTIGKLTLVISQKCTFEAAIFIFKITLCVQSFSRESLVIHLIPHFRHCILYLLLTNTVFIEFALSVTNFNCDTCGHTRKFNKSPLLKKSNLV